MGATDDLLSWYHFYELLWVWEYVLTKIGFVLLPVAGYRQPLQEVKGGSSGTTHSREQRGKKQDPACLGCAQLAFCSLRQFKTQPVTGSHLLSGWVYPPQLTIRTLRHRLL